VTSGLSVLGLYWLQGPIEIFIPALIWFLLFLILKLVLFLSLLLHLLPLALSLLLSLHLQLLLHLNKVTLFLEGLGTSLKYETYGIPHRVDRFNEIFFGNPWTPSIYLVLQTQFYLDFKRHSDDQIARKIGVSENQVKQSLSDLQLLHLIQFQGTHYQVVKGTFLAPPSSLTKNKNVQNLKKYWMDRSAGFRDWPGIHRIEQATVSHESKEKILLWISELREKIAQEIKVTQPQTILHLHLQAFDLLADHPENIPAESKL
jgi:hypothetical protein